MTEPTKVNEPSPASAEPKPIIGGGKTPPDDRLPKVSSGAPMSGLVGGTAGDKGAPSTPADTPRIAKMKEISGKLGEILKEFGSESNVPVTNNEYWALKAEMNALRNESTS